MNLHLILNSCHFTFIAWSSERMAPPKFTKTLLARTRGTDTSARRRAESKSQRSTSSRYPIIQTAKLHRNKRNRSPAEPSTVVRRRNTRQTPTETEESTVVCSQTRRRQQRPQVLVETVNRDKPESSSQRAFYLQFIKSIFELGVEGIVKLYNAELRAYFPANITRQAFDKNPTKNRYSDVVCLDSTRVKLRNWSTDYIHANYVKTEVLTNSGFICTQGPMTTTVCDFWHMVCQEQAANIVMLCETMELGKEKCQQYWPRRMNETLEFPGFRIRNMGVDTSDSVTVISLLEVRRVFGSEVDSVSRKCKPHYVRHHLWKNWPDRGVPSSTLAPFRILAQVRPSTSPCVVHCSAGIGRTGTLVAIEACLQTLLLERPLNVVEVIKELRSMRIHTIQTDLQFLFVYKCLIAQGIVRGILPKELGSVSRKFSRDYNSLLATRLAVQPKAPLPTRSPPVPSPIRYPC
ncbi:Tyrosine-protein phosphatase non-receptor type 9 [Aphelenchoides besseyi]|nr:Tyrosine-protein phosphatase non-receptor type 9 [Aphelenchoides besseyi]KAI6208854.1 Tyrosine-protein phosphatase non-receptor type 9 [Aphelenchoides besseyi]